MVKKTKTLRETYIFGQMNKNGFIDDKVKMFTNPNTSIVVTPEMLEEEVIHINKTFKYPAKMAVIEAFKNKSLIPVMLKHGVNDKMPVAIPFMISKDHSRAMVFIDNYATINRDGIITIDYKKLYCLMESAYLSMEGLKRNNTALINKGSMIFAHIFTRVLNKQFSLNTNRSAMNKVIFLASKYFMYNHLGMTDHNMVFNYALKNCNSATAILMRDVDAEFEPVCYTDISTFLTKMASTSYQFVSGFEKITTRDFIASYASMYGQSTLLSLESLDYFMFMISSVVIGAYLNNQTILEDIIDKDGAKLYLEMGR